MTRAEFEARVARLHAGAVGKIEMMVDPDEMLCTQRCVICKATMLTQMEISSAGDERLLTDLQAFQDAHGHRS